MSYFKIIILSLLFAYGSPSQAQIQGIENAPTSVLDVKELEEIQAYATNANISIIRLLSQFKQLQDNADEDETNVPILKQTLFTGVEKIIGESKDHRSILLLSHALQTGMILVKFIEKEAIEKGTTQAPQGIVNKQLYILKQSLIFARDYYISDHQFIEDVLSKNEQVTNPKFAEFGVKLTSLVIEMTKGITNVRVNYGMIRWSLAVLANYLIIDKNTNFNHSSTITLLTDELTQKTNGAPTFPDLLNGEPAPNDIQCIMKTRNLKLLAENSLKEIEESKKQVNTHE